MYGMIHRALRQMVLDTEGSHTWQVIEQRAAIGPAHLISSAVYDDDTTLRVLSATSETLNEALDRLLYRFGIYWIEYAEKSSFAPILNFTGADLESFIRNLDTMHRTITDVLPGSQMPSFQVQDQQPGRMIVQYRSHRTGLEPFVEGLLVGLIERFGLEGSVNRLSAGDAGVIFSLEYRQR
ncbi:MAG: heme NO-binding domain-containing protein [Novosphingobium sp.]|jgi:hypothetical protein|nr:heme NO-binding domain-containing protein [Brevundimonas sp.]